MGRFIALASFLSLGLLISPAQSQEETPSRSVSDKLEAALNRATTTDYDLHYKYRQDEVVQTQVTHLVTIETRMGGVAETAQTRSISVKNWRITNVDERGSITLVNSIDSVDMWQQHSGQAALTYNSKTDEEPSAIYQKVAESIGIPLSTITISKHGAIISREDHLPGQSGSDMGGLMMPLPDHRVKVGDVWTSRVQVAVKLKDGRIQSIQVRQSYELKDVSDGVATIDVRTDILTPLNDAWVEAQLVQRMQNGTVRFDIDAGRLVSRQMDMDETVIGFSGEDSSMNYLARFIEEPISGDQQSEARTARTPNEIQQDSQNRRPIQGPAPPQR